MVAISNPSLERARQHVETLTRSLFQIHGYTTPADPVVGRIVDAAVGGIMAAGDGLRQLQSPESIGNAAIGMISQMVQNSQEASKPVNAFSAEAARKQVTGEGGATKSVWGLEGLDAIRVAVSRSRDTMAGGASDTVDRNSSSGARFDAMSSMDWGSPAGLAKMRDYAIQSGVPWAANNPELLRLGPAAVGALAAVQFKQETYKQLTTDASFKAKDVVTLARFAKEQHVDANTLGSSFAKVEQGMTPEERAKFNGAVVPYMANSTNPETRQKAVKAFDDAKKAHPEKKEEFDALQGQLKLKGQALEHAKDATAAKDRKADAKDSRADTKEKGATDKLAALDALGGDTPIKAPPAPTAPTGEKGKALATASNKQPAATQPQKPAGSKPAAAPGPH